MVFAQQKKNHISLFIYILHNLLADLVKHLSLNHDQAHKLVV